MFNPTLVGHRPFDSHFNPASHIHAFESLEPNTTTQFPALTACPKPLEENDIGNLQ